MAICVSISSLESAQPCGRPSRITRYWRVRGSALVAAWLVVNASIAPANAQDGALAERVAKLQADLVSIKGELALLDRQIALTAPEFRVGTAATRRIELRTRHGSIVIDADGISITADNVRINGKHIAIGGDDSLLLKSSTITLQGEKVEQQASGSRTIKGSTIREN